MAICFSHFKCVIVCVRISRHLEFVETHVNDRVVANDCWLTFAFNLSKEIAMNIFKHPHVFGEYSAETTCEDIRVHMNSDQKAVFDCTASCVASIQSNAFHKMLKVNCDESVTLDSFESVMKGLVGERFDKYRNQKIASFAIAMLIANELISRLYEPNEEGATRESVIKIVNGNDAIEWTIYTSGLDPLITFGGFLMGIDLHCFKTPDDYRDFATGIFNHLANIV